MQIHKFKDKIENKDYELVYLTDEDSLTEFSLSYNIQADIDNIPVGEWFVWSISQDGQGGLRGDIISDSEFCGVIENVVSKYSEMLRFLRSKIKNVEYIDNLPLPFYWGLIPWLYRRLTGWRDEYGRKAQFIGWK
jgi:hypothetical protein